MAAKCGMKHYVCKITWSYLLPGSCGKVMISVVSFCQSFCAQGWGWFSLVAITHGVRAIHPLCVQSRGVLVFLKFAQFSSELTKTWSSGATECGVWIGNCNVKVWKSTEHKLHNIWRSVKFQQNEHTPEQPSVDGPNSSPPTRHGHLHGPHYTETPPQS